MGGESHLQGETGRRWPLWCRYDPEEMRWLYGVPDASQSRRVGFFLAATVALAAAVAAGYSLGQGDVAGGAFRVADGPAFLVLGCLAYRGKSWASLGLMALYTVEPTAAHLIGHTHGTTYLPDRFGLWPADVLLAWAMWMRVYYVAFRAERRQAASASGPDALAAAGS